MNSNKIKECTELASEILRNFELSEIPVSNIVLKCLRLCRLLGDEDGVLLFSYEASGYPKVDNKLTEDAKRIAIMAGRRYTEEKIIDGKSVPQNYINTELIGTIETTISSLKLRLSAAKDPNISISSANPYQHVQAPSGNVQERNIVLKDIRAFQTLLLKIQGSMYNYILQIYNKLSYGNIVEDTFTSNRLQVNEVLSKLCPQSLGKFVAVYDNMDSNNPEDWANAVHSCRRILLDLADSLYPPKETPICINGKTIKLDKDHYINRLLQFVSEKQESKAYIKIVGSDLEYIGKRVDAVYNATNKGTHSEISKDEASRYIIHTYLLISDIIALQ